MDQKRLEEGLKVCRGARTGQLIAIPFPSRSSGFVNQLESLSKLHKPSVQYRGAGQRGDRGFGGYLEMDRAPWLQLAEAFEMGHSGMVGILKPECEVVSGCPEMREQLVRCIAEAGGHFMILHLDVPDSS